MAALRCLWPSRWTSQWCRPCRNRCGDACLWSCPLRNATFFLAAKNGKCHMISYGNLQNLHFFRSQTKVKPQHLWVSWMKIRTRTHPQLQDGTRSQVVAVGLFFPSTGIESHQWWRHRLGSDSQLTGGGATDAIWRSDRPRARTEAGVDTAGSPGGP